MTQTLFPTARRLRQWAGAALLVAALPAQAQSLPSWAKPSASESGTSAPTTMMVPCPPGQSGSPCTGTAPRQVPLDGGLALLALAGGAYAARRLRAA